MFSHVASYGGDPILGLMEKFSSDQRTQKVNLGVGIYYDEDGRVPVLRSIRAAQQQLLAHNQPSTYLPMEGDDTFRKHVAELIFGVDVSEAIANTAVVQTLGGSGALKLGADFLRRHFPSATVHVSDPTWDNHIGLFEGAGFKVRRYRYYQPSSRNLDLGGMLEDLERLTANDVVLLHPCCHNPTGVDPSRADWMQIIKVIEKRRPMVFVDIAYQGLSIGLEDDLFVVRELARRDMDFLVSHSFSKIFSLYGERCGSLSVHCSNTSHVTNVLGQLKLLVRRSYSNPPTYGMRLISTVLGDPSLRGIWIGELEAMRFRMTSMRRLLRDHLEAILLGPDFSFLTNQTGMFAYTGLTNAQVIRLRDEFGIYAVSSGRICISGLRPDNVQHVASSYAAVLST
jgi:aromatic-amino-acid transaminase